MKYQKGFTLLELMIAFAILAIVTAIAISNWSSYAQNQRLRTAAGEIIGTLAQAGAQARAQSTAYYVDFNVAQNNYALEREGGNPVIRNFSAPEIALTAADFGGETYAKFLARGVVEDEGYVTLENGRGSTARIDVKVLGKSSITYKMK